MDYRLNRSDTVDYCCIICLQVLQEPVQCRKCKCKLCRSCMFKWIQEKSQCPMRCEPENDIYQMFTVPPYNFLQILRQREFSCPYSDNGCQQKIKYDQLSSHSKKCEYKMLKCLSCEMPNILKKSIVDHLECCPMIGFIKPQDSNSKEFYVQISYQDILKQQQHENFTREQERINKFLEEINKRKNQEISEYKDKILKLTIKEQFNKSKANGFNNLKFDPKVCDIHEQYKLYKDWLLKDYLTFKNKLKNMFLKEKIKSIVQNKKSDQINIPEYLNGTFPKTFSLFTLHQENTHKKEKGHRKKLNSYLSPSDIDSIRGSTQSICKNRPSSSNALQQPINDSSINTFSEISDIENEQMPILKLDQVSSVFTQFIKKTVQSSIPNYFQIPKNEFNLFMDGSKQTNIYKIQELKLENIIEHNQSVKINIDINKFTEGTFIFFTFTSDKKGSENQIYSTFDIDNEKDYLAIMKSLQSRQQVQVEISIDYEQTFENNILTLGSYFKPINQRITTTIENECDMNQWNFSIIVVAIGEKTFYRNNLETNLNITIENV